MRINFNGLFLTNVLRTAAFFIFLLLFSQSGYSQDFADGYYRLTTKWLGEEKSLDILNDGVNNKIQMAESGNYTGQHWKITPLGNGYYRLTTEWLGESKSLDIINDGANNKLHMDKSANLTGQHWKITPVRDGYYRLTTEWLGDKKVLDVVNDGINNKLKLATWRDYSAQYWKITYIVSKNTKQTDLHGFKIIINSAIAEKQETKTALNLLSENLEEITRIVKPEQLKLLKTVPIWIEIKQVADKAIWYHKYKDWVVRNAYPEEMAMAVEICNVKNFVDWQKQNQPYMVLHELAHAYHNLYFESKGRVTDAYKMAFASGKYDSVDYNLGGKRKAYAMDNADEYFAELTEAYLGKNDYYPFNRQELKDFDPEGYKVMQRAWD